ncbi:OLC1v1027509C1 [Oldenlandia corymbosa var. corymbosa]|uniref:OLC1v1027509C1 n=1 Tax=Oldenlandia corymbosa var. corymbosa TaxID=529605 RepID=A0AAV1CBM0_OLDCO|nr:OLC1v1027509C1 [Oldenlandia corymbosa var. corymbosa]
MAAQQDQVNPATATAAISPPIYISTPTLRSIITHRALIDHLKRTLPTNSTAIQSPLRHAHQTSPASSLLLMPSWSNSPSLPYIGVKLVTFNSNNSTLNLPGVHASYVLFNSLTGQTLASMDATELTLYRTSCISALASEYLSRKDSQTLLMIGAGAMAPHLIRAHVTVRPSLKRVIVWNRSVEKAKALVDNLRKEGGFDEGLSFEECNGSLEEFVRVADIVSCATCSETPLVKGQDLKNGAHLDLVGSFTHSMRECDDEAIRRSRVFIDNEAATVEAGELVGALERGVISRDDIVGDLVELIKREKVVGRRDEEEITVFKSVGSAVVDLISAQMVYETYMNDH